LQLATYKQEITNAATTKVAMIHITETTDDKKLKIDMKKDTVIACMYTVFQKKNIHSYYWL